MRSMSEILFLCGSNEKTVISTLNILDGDIEGSVECLDDEVSIVTFPHTCNI